MGMGPGPNQGRAGTDDEGGKGGKVGGDEDTLPTFHIFPFGKNLLRFSNGIASNIINQHKRGNRIKCLNYLFVRRILSPVYTALFFQIGS